MTYTCERKRKNVPFRTKGCKPLFSPPLFLFLYFKFPSLPLLSPFPSLVISSLSVSLSLLSFPHTSLPPSKIPLSFHLSFFLRARSVAHVPGARSRARTQEISLSLSLLSSAEGVREREIEGRRKKKRGGRAGDGRE